MISLKLGGICTSSNNGGREKMQLFVKVNFLKQARRHMHPPHIYAHIHTSTLSHTHPHTRSDKDMHAHSHIVAHTHVIFLTLPFSIFIRACEDGDGSRDWKSAPFLHVCRLLEQFSWRHTTILLSRSSQQGGTIQTTHSNKDVWDSCRMRRH